MSLLVTQRPAAPTNYHKGRKSPITRVVLHITDAETLASTVSWFQNPLAHVSAHYVIDRNGTIVQMVAEGDTAWHCPGSNANGIGIEHVARGLRKGKRPLLVTPEQYEASARLVRDICARHGIARDRANILGHNEANTSTAHAGCPTAAFDFAAFWPLVVA